MQVEKKDDKKYFVSEVWNVFAERVICFLDKVHGIKNRIAHFWFLGFPHSLSSWMGCTLSYYLLFYDKFLRWVNITWELHSSKLEYMAARKCFMRFWWCTFNINYAWISRSTRIPLTFSELLWLPTFHECFLWPEWIPSFKLAIVIPKWI